VWFGTKEAEPRRLIGRRLWAACDQVRTEALLERRQRLRSDALAFCSPHLKKSIHVGSTSMPASWRNITRSIPTR
jgi:hypothetical protein